MVLDRIRVVLHRATLDARLAEGEAVSCDPLLALRATQLLAARARRRVAAALERALDDPAGGFSAAIPVNRRAVRSARPYLVRLVEVLRSSEEVAPQGVARAGRLLTDVASPLYAPAEPSDLHQEARLALFWLDPTPDPSHPAFSEVNGTHSAR